MSKNSCLSSDDIVNAFDRTAHHGEQANVCEATIAPFFWIAGGITLKGNE